MPRFFFHYRTDDRLIRDLDGSEHPDLDAAELRAGEIGRAIVERLAAEDEDAELRGSIEITDAAGAELLYVVFWAGPPLAPGGTPFYPTTLH
ncbi:MULTISPECIES: hypothetical protein [unclassified Devosia]|uniref:DUF6894 family protein n=1 Tax=unclassified Devosia TaxID=196773 RepID=UPI000FD6DB96|nr:MULTISPECIES: hypothetical protein [unclassified Devosia]